MDNSKLVVSHNETLREELMLDSSSSDVQFEQGLYISVRIWARLSSLEVCFEQSFRVQPRDHIMYFKFTSYQVVCLLQLKGVKLWDS